MRRRDVLKLLGTAVCTSAVQRVSAAETTKLRWKTAIGLNGFQSASAKYGKTFPIWEILDFASRAGLTGLNCCLTGHRPWSITLPLTTPSPFATQTALRRLRPAGLFDPDIRCGSLRPDPAIRRQWLDVWRRNAQFAKAVGADCIGIWPGGSLGEQTEAQAIEHLAESFREVWKCAGDLGLTASFELEPPFVFRSEEHMRQNSRRCPGFAPMSISPISTCSAVHRGGSAI